MRRAQPPRPECSEGANELQGLLRRPSGYTLAFEHDPHKRGCVVLQRNLSSPQWPQLDNDRESVARHQDSFCSAPTEQSPPPPRSNEGGSARPRQIPAFDRGFANRVKEYLDSQLPLPAQLLVTSGPVQRQDRSRPLNLRPWWKACDSPPNAASVFVTLPSRTWREILGEEKGQADDLSRDPGRRPKLPASADTGGISGGAGKGSVTDELIRSMGRRGQPPDPRPLATNCPLQPRAGPIAKAFCGSPLPPVSLNLFQQARRARATNVYAPQQACNARCLGVPRWPRRSLDLPMPLASPSDQLTRHPRCDPWRQVSDRCGGNARCAV